MEGEIEYRNIYGEGISKDEFYKLLLEDHHVGNDKIGKYWISTVWSVYPLSPHEYFETMVFDQSDPKNQWRDLYCVRYETLEQAEQGHKKALEMVKTKPEGEWGEEEHENWENTRIKKIDRI